MRVLGGPIPIIGYISSRSSSYQRGVIQECQKLGSALHIDGAVGSLISHSSELVQEAMMHPSSREKLVQQGREGIIVHPAQAVFRYP